MSINVKTGQWHCFAGCGGGSIFQFVTKKDGVDHSTAVAIVYGSEPKITSKIHAKYDYRDEGGLLLFQAIRFEPKDFAQRRPDPSNSGKWINNLKAFEEFRIVYRNFWRRLKTTARPILFSSSKEKKMSKVYAVWA